MKYVHFYPTNREEKSRKKKEEVLQAQEKNLLGSALSLSKTCLTFSKQSFDHENLSASHVGQRV